MSLVLTAFHQLNINFATEPCSLLPVPLSLYIGEKDHYVTRGAYGDCMGTKLAFILKI